MSGTLLDVENLEVSYPRKGLKKKPFVALRGVSLDVRAGETVGLVGESGSGKSTLGRAVLGLAPISGGKIEFGGRDITHLSRRERRELTGDLQVVFQDPYSSLNPSMTIEDILIEPLLVRNVSRSDARRRVNTLLDQVRLPAGSASRLPREFSGGQRQRIAIARALALRPRLIVCDEPVSALDLTTQLRVLDLFAEIQRETGVSYLFISHDLAVVRHVSSRVAVMLGGEIVESGSAADVIDRPQHNYTKKLFLAAPVPDPDLQLQRRQERQLLAASEAGAQ